MGVQTSAACRDKAIISESLPREIGEGLRHCGKHNSFKDCFELIRGYISRYPWSDNESKILFCDCFEAFSMENTNIGAYRATSGKKVNHIASKIIYNYWLMKLGIIKKHTHITLLRYVANTQPRKHFYAVLRQLKEKSFVGGNYIGVPGLQDFFGIKHFDKMFGIKEFVDKLYKFDVGFEMNGTLSLRHKKKTYNCLISANFVIIDQYKKYICKCRENSAALAMGHTLLSLKQACEYSEGDSITISKKSIISITENKTISKYLESL